MIKDILKGLWKWFIWILILFLLLLIILAFRIFVIDKDYGKDDKSKYGKNGQVTDTVNGSGNGSVSGSISNGLKSIGNSVVSGYKNDSEYDFFSTNFDEWFLMCEGDQKGGTVKNALEHLLENSRGNFYARTSVTAVGFGENNTVEFNGDLEEYQTGIQNMKDAVELHGDYEVSFKYAGIMTYVNEIVITKK